jgi:hypothetical protein
VVDGARKRVTYAEYVAFTKSADLKHEYIAGDVRAMAGGTIEHGRLMASLALLLGSALRGRPCVVMPADVRVRIRAAERATYPDLHVVCNAVERDPDDDHAVVNPTVIVEVLSEATEDGDRTDICTRGTVGGGFSTSIEPVTVSSSGRSMSSSPSTMSTWTRSARFSRLPSARRPSGSERAGRCGTSSS